MSEQVKTTARDLIRRSMMLIGALGQGENPTDQEANDALLTLNEIVDKWNIESLMITASSTIEVPMIAKRTYTWGPSGDINSIRPATGIEAAYYLQPTSGGDVSMPVQIVTQVQYNAITLKDLVSQIPQMIYYNATYPLAELSVYPVSNFGKLVLDISNQFMAFPTLDAMIDLPSAYIKALRYNLAVELSIEYGRQLDDRVEQLAIGAKNTIKAINSTLKKNIMITDPALRGRGGSFNIYTGE